MVAGRQTDFPSSFLHTPNPKTPLQRRQSVIQQLGTWFQAGDSRAAQARLNAELADKIPTFKKRGGRKRRAVVYDVGGNKTITTGAAYAYLLNQFIDCLPALPYMVLAAGWVPALGANIFVSLIASFMALMTLRSMTMIEGNQNFEMRYEYVPTAQYFLGPRVATLLEIGFHMLQILNFLTINSLARVVDTMLMKAFGVAIGFEIYPACQLVKSSTSLEDLYINVFTGAKLYTISAGYILCCFFCIPLTRYNLEEGSNAQLAILAVSAIAILVLLGSASASILAHSSVTLAAVILKGTLYPVRTLKRLLMTSIRLISRAMGRVSKKKEGPSSLIQSGFAISRDTPLIDLVAGLDNAALFEIQGPSGFKSPGELEVAIRHSRQTPYLTQCNKCATSLCIGAGKQVDKTPLLWNFTLEQLLLATWRAARSGATPVIPTRWGRYQFQRTFGTLIGGYSFANMIPSWANELQNNVSIPTVLWRCTLSSAVLFFCFGWLIAYAFPNIESDDALQDIIGRHQVSPLFAVAAYVLELLTIALGVVVNCVATRYNLTNSGLLRPPAAFIFGCVVPFLFAWMFAGESWITAFFGWASLILSLICNFIIPGYVYIVACKSSPLAYRNPSRHKTVRLGIEAFVPQRGSVPDVQAALRKWAATMVNEDPELQALLNRGESECDEPLHSLATLRSRDSRHAMLTRRHRASRTNISPATGRSWYAGLGDGGPSSQHISNDDVGPYKRRVSATGERLDALQRRFTVVDIIASYQDSHLTGRRSSDRSTSISCLSRRSSSPSLYRKRFNSNQRASLICPPVSAAWSRRCLSSAPSSQSQNASQEDDISCVGREIAVNGLITSVPGWSTMVAEYEQRLAAGQLNYTSEDSSDLERETNDESRSKQSILSSAMLDVSPASRISHNSQESRTGSHSLLLRSSRVPVYVRTSRRWSRTAFCPTGESSNAAERNQEQRSGRNAGPEKGWGLKRSGYRRSTMKSLVSECSSRQLNLSARSSRSKGWEEARLQERRLTAQGSSRLSLDSRCSISNHDAPTSGNCERDSPVWKRANLRNSAILSGYECDQIGQDAVDDFMVHLIKQEILQRHVEQRNDRHCRANSSLSHSSRYHNSSNKPESSCDESFAPAKRQFSEPKDRRFDSHRCPQHTDEVKNETQNSVILSGGSHSSFQKNLAPEGKSFRRLRSRSQPFLLAPDNHMRIHRRRRLSAPCTVTGDFSSTFDRDNNKLLDLLLYVPVQESSSDAKMHQSGSLSDTPERRQSFGCPINCVDGTQRSSSTRASAAGLSVITAQPTVQTPCEPTITTVEVPLPMPVNKGYGGPVSKRFLDTYESKLVSDAQESSSNMNMRRSSYCGNLNRSQIRQAVYTPANSRSRSAPPHHWQSSNPLQHKAAPPENSLEKASSSDCGRNGVEKLNEGGNECSKFRSQSDACLMRYL